MTFRYRNSSGASTFDIDLGNQAVRLGSISSGFAGRAELGEPGSGGVEVDDPGGVLDILNLQYFVVVESDAPAGDDVVALSVINDLRIRRGDASRASLRTGADRVWALDLMDPNEFLGFRLLHSFSRPAETAAARLTAMLAVSNCPVHDLGLVVYPTHAMDKNDYTWQSFQQVLADVAAQAGYNYFAYYDQTAGQFGLFFDDPDSTAYTSSARISNILADLGAGVYAPLEGTTELLRSGSRIASTGVVQYSGGAQAYYSSATADVYTAIDRVAPSSNIKTAAAALAVATKYQKASNSPSDRITTTIRVPRANVNDIREGHRLQARFSHLATTLGAYSEWTWFRVMSRTVMQPEETDQTYQMALELTPQTQLTCSLSVGTAVVAHITDQNTTTSPYSLSITPGGDSLVVAAFLAGGTGMTISGVATTASVNDTGHETSALGWAAASSTTTVSASYTATSAHEAAAMAAIPTRATSPVQSVSAGWYWEPVATLPAPPTAGNMLVAVYMCGVPSLAADMATHWVGWTLLVEGTANGIHPFGGNSVGVMVKCSDGTETDWAMLVSTDALVTLMEWAVT